MSLTPQKEVVSVTKMNVKLTLDTYQDVISQKEGASNETNSTALQNIRAADIKTSTKKAGKLLAENIAYMVGIPKTRTSTR